MVGDFDVCVGLVELGSVLCSCLTETVA